MLRSLPSLVIFSSTENWLLSGDFGTRIRHNTQFNTSQTLKQNTAQKFIQAVQDTINTIITIQIQLIKFSVNKF